MQAGSEPIVTAFSDIKGQISIVDNEVVGAPYLPTDGLINVSSGILAFGLTPCLNGFQQTADVLIRGNVVVGPSTMRDSAILVPSLVLGIVIGELVHRHVSEARFRVAVHVLLLTPASPCWPARSRTTGRARTTRGGTDRSGGTAGALPWSCDAYEPSRC